MTTQPCRRLPSRFALLTGLAASALCPFACAPLPDVTPFSSATSQLATAVRSSGKATADEVAEMTNGKRLAADLNTAWEARIAAMTAVTSYADGLAAIVKASEDAGDSAKLLAEKVGTLATAAGIINPAAGVSVKVVADTAKLVWTNIARAKGAADLETALDAAQPAIETIAETLVKDGQDLRLAVRAAVANEKIELVGDPAINTVRSLHAGGALGKSAIIGSFDIGSGKPFPTELQEKLATIDRVLESTRPEFEASEQKLAALALRKKTLLALISATDDSLLRWADAHRNLAAAVRERKPIDLNSLLDGIVEIRDLIKKVREQ